MDKSHLKSLVEKGHEIGLHSHTHSHPFKMALLNKNDQYTDYHKNHNMLKKINFQILIILQILNQKYCLYLQIFEKASRK